MTEQAGAETDERQGPCPAFLEAGRMLTTLNRQVSERVRDREAMLAENREAAKRQVNPHNPVSAVLPDWAWAGQRCFVIGGGPSLSQFDFERLRGRGRVIAINRAYEYIPFADVCFFMDKRFYDWVKGGKFGEEALRKWNEFSGLKVFLNILGRKFDDVYSVRSLGRIGLSNSLARGIYHGNNSGVGAVGLAYTLGANPIYLLGFDFRFDGNKSHFHSGYKMPMRETVVRSFLRDFERMYRYLVRTRARVVNLNPQSALRLFPFSTIDEVLGNGKISESAGMGQAEAAGLQNDVL